MPVSKIKTQKSKLKSTSQNSKVKTTTVKRTTGSKNNAKASSLIAPVFGLDGARKGSVSLNKDIFGAKVNNALMVQAVRVYMVNQRQGTAYTKTRGEVIGSTRKIYRQKGTGRARHGAIKAPIFVGGGIAHGPKPRNFELKLSKQMKKKALFSSLSEKAASQKIFIIDSEKASGKTKEIYELLKKLNLIAKKDTKILFVSGPKSAAARAVKNIDGVNLEPSHNLNTYEVINSDTLVFAKETISEIEKTFLGGTK